MALDVAVVNGLIVDPSWGEFRGSIGVKDGKVAMIAAPGEVIEAAEYIDASEKVVMPGVIDPHVHLGFARDFGDDIASETRSAALGGVTTVMSFHRQYQGQEPRPYDELPELIETINRNAYIDVALHFGMLAETQVDQIGKYVESGVSSYKFYMAYRGADGATVGMVNECDDGLLLEGLSNVAKSGAVACIHAENTDIVNRSMRQVKESGATGLEAWSAARPAFAESENIARVSLFAEHVGAEIYLVHIGSSESLVAAAAAKRKSSSPVWVETCSHYLTHTFDHPAGTLAKINPPIRTEIDREALWRGLIDGTIDTVGTDHCAVPHDRKVDDIWTTAAGFPGVATLLPVLLSEGYHQRGMSLQRISQVLSGRAAEIFGLTNKGSLRPGSDADLVVCDLESSRTVDAGALGSSAEYSILEGQELRGWPVRTLVRGVTVMADGELSPRARGQFIPH